MGSHIVLLIKIFDKEEYADAFINNGEMYCRTIGDFKSIDDEGIRGDAFEGATDWHQPDKISMAISYSDSGGVKHSVTLSDLAGPVIMQSSGYDRLNVYCMYAVKIPAFEASYDTEEERGSFVEGINTMLKEKLRLDDEIYSLGHFSVVIFHVSDFIHKVEDAARAKSYDCWNSPVEYFYAETFHGSFKGLKAIFRKRNTYEHQSEYRFVFGSNEPEGHKTIHLGSLNRIGFKVPTKNINESVQLKLDA